MTDNITDFRKNPGDCVASVKLLSLKTDVICR